jgi:uroporphyrin-III C-methyltransferase
MPSQKTVTGELETIEEKVKDANIANPAIVLVGQVVKIREKVKWFE